MSKAHCRGVPAGGRSRPAPAQSILLVVLALGGLGAVHGGLGKLLPAINKLQDVMASIAERGSAVELPQIVVVGSQSSGKSSVLESIVGKDFLPRGSGIVTRAPLILQLQTYRGRIGAGECEEWGEFLHCPKKRFTVFKDIRKEIEDETERITGKKQAISHNPIRLRITSPHVPDLTLVDLPGMTKVPVGDQPADIETQIRDLVLKYTANPNSIILSVTPANSDMATSDSIQIARAVDPKGDRTIGVLTKLDLMDKGTNALAMLQGKVVHLKLGFIGVINRSQKDIADEKDLESSRKDELKFFASHPAYAQLAASHHIGTVFLARRLNSILLSHIKARLPALRNRIMSLVATSRKELQSLGEAPSDDADDHRKMLLSVITQYVDNFCTTIDGGRHLTSFSELRGGARISHTFNQLFPQRLNAILPHENLPPSEIHMTIRNTKGARTSLYGSVPQDAFEMLVKKLIKQLREPASWCVDTVFDELRMISEECEPKELQRFEILRNRFREVSAEMLSRCFRDAKKMIESLILFELAYINTNHPDFCDIGAVLGATFVEPLNLQAPPPKQQQGPPPQAPPTAGAAGDQGNPLNWFGGKESKAGRTSAPAVKQGKGGGAEAAAPVEPVEAPKSRAEQMQLARRLQHDREARREWLREGLAGVQLDPREEGEIELVITLIVSYFDIVRKNLRDSVPKAIMHFMVNQAKDKVQVELLRSLYKEDLMSEVFVESPETTEQRKQCRQMVGALEKALGVLNEVRSMQE